MVRIIKTIASNPFTPKSGWEPRVFIGREKETEVFKKKLEEAKSGRCDHFLVLGEWGIGKTSLLKEFKKIAQQQNVLTSLVSISEYKKEYLRDGVKELIEQIPRKLPVETSKLRRFMKYIDSLDIQVLGSGFSFSRKIEGMQPSTLLLDILLNLWADLKKETEAIVVLLDDVQNFSAISHIFTLLDKKLNKKSISPQEIVNLSNDLKLNLSATVIKTGLQRLFTKNLVIKPEKFQYSLPDKMFVEYVFRLKGFDGIKIQNIQNTL